MELKEFITETLSQIIEGVQEAQKREGGDNINAEFAAYSGGNLMNGGRYGTATRVDFDVSVSAETAGGGSASLKVFSFGAEGGGKHTASSANRITFSVPVRLPDGDKERANTIEQENQAFQREAEASLSEDRGLY